MGGLPSRQLGYGCAILEGALEESAGTEDMSLVVSSRHCGWREELAQRGRLQQVEALRTPSEAKAPLQGALRVNPAEGRAGHRTGPRERLDLGAFTRTQLTHGEF